MANNKFKAAVKRAKKLYKTGRFKKFSDAVSVAYGKVTRSKKRPVKKRRRPVSTKTSIGSRISSSKRRSPVVSQRRQLEKKLGDVLVQHWKTKSIKQTKRLDKKKAELKRKIKSLS